MHLSIFEASTLVYKCFLKKKKKSHLLVNLSFDECSVSLEFSCKVSVAFSHQIRLLERIHTFEDAAATEQLIQSTPVRSVLEKIISVSERQVKD